MAKSLLYTATGDKGTTSLVGGERIRKNAPRLEAYGTLDEFSAFLGVALTRPDCTDELKGQLLEIQNRLFDLGCYLATAPAADQQPPTDDTPAAGIDARTITQLEGWIDTLDEQTPKIREFILPGGSQMAAALHVARTICRRAERRIIDLADTEPVAPMVIRYVNRLSDYLFIAARYSNFIAGVAELTWKPAKQI